MACPAAGIPCRAVVSPSAEEGRWSDPVGTIFPAIVDPWTCRDPPLLMLTGDRVDNAAEVARLLGLTEVVADADPADKIAAISAERHNGVTVMVGDGVNDAPALAAADVGVALGSRGSTAAVQAADAVIVDDRIDRLADAVEIAQRSHRLAVQSATAGMAMSLAAMIAAAFGLLMPAAGALLQEGIDVAVILNALRALRVHRGRPTAAIEPLVARFTREHGRLRTARASVRQAADALSGVQDRMPTPRSAARSNSWWTTYCRMSTPRNRNCIPR